MGKKLKIGIALVVAVALAVVVAVVATLASLDFNQYRSTIAAEVKAATGRDLVIAGDIDLELGLTSRLVVDNVTLANASWGSRPEMARVERLEAEVPLLPLVSGEVVVDRLVVIGADVLLEVDEAGRGNWLFDVASRSERKAAEGAPTIPVVSDVRLERSTLTYRDGDKSHRVRIDRLTGKAAGITAPLTLELAGTVDDVPLTLAGELGAIRALVEAEPYPVTLRLTLGGLALTVEGQIAKPLEGKGLDLVLQADAAELADLAPLTGTELPKLGPVKVGFRLSDDGKGYAIKGLDAKLGASDLAGDVGVRLGGARPRIEATLASKLIDLDGLVPSGSGKQATGDGRIFPDDPLPLAALGAVDADLNYQAGQVKLAGIAVRELALKASLKKGALRLAPLTAKLAKGNLRLQATVDGGKSPPRVNVKLTLDKADLGQLLQATADSDLLSGRMDLKFDAKGKGASVRQLMAGLGGRANLVVTEGYIANSHVELIAADLLSSLTPGSEDAKGTKVNCAVVDFPISAGLARAKVLLLDTERMTVTGEGTVSLKTEKIDLKLKPKPKDASLVSLATPVLVGGTLAEPTAVPDPVALASGVAAAVAGNVLLPGAGLLLPLLDSGSDETHPCLRAVSSKTAATPAPAKTSAPAPKTEEKEGGVGGFLKGLGKSIDKALGVEKE